MHNKYMQLALQQARKGCMSTTPNPRVGCVVVKNEQVIATGFHQVAGSAHAEVNALRGDLAQYEGSTIYVTLEPCSHFGRTPPCCNLIIRAKPSKVVVAMLDPNPQVAGKGIKAIQKAGIAVEVGCCEDEALQLNEGYIRRMQGLPPRIVAKVAMSLDGKMAIKGEKKQCLINEKSQHDAMRLRAESCAVVTDIDTMLADDPLLNVQIEAEHIRQPDIIILDPKLSLPLDSQIIKQHCDRKVFVLTTSLCAQPEKEKRLADLDVTVVNVAHYEDKVSLSEVKLWLSDTDYHNILVESGPALISEFIKSNMLNEMVIYQAPILLGYDAIDLFSGKITALSAAPTLQLDKTENIESDIKLIYKFNIE
ncbi:MAG: bifunctional diaminohydroxyphosphoribosylaminopyrimidine deaminase/5-amino-6-(5-phosphoribosylamino)uracil reductase RibD [Vibrio sp.]|uniref:bifunctional diaminohydroxyphosphoribosylaminopyrimidine deaminase/5-amino-6-(5-phosphoribosylamino)uracil reductase RibD n=1 Tax=Vibrio TaxID=662 RepID=UPI001EC68FFF|nr:bifunctional diaminohydroxyphosphoribosylaminopyrimidine deaminase/5-amino-6-(5-phosphoribosylamino)uracil reductase RibD [Vibrio sp.]NRB66291.1 bifunctional diaminohydroxyphosphoribosylaminopyrimidine deaminase/5-amino-6-(5-phosphoribosylamino)uracil reductase RibD [Vibrio sp.]